MFLFWRLNAATPARSPPRAGERGFRAAVVTFHPPWSSGGTRLKKKSLHLQFYQFQTDSRQSPSGGAPALAGRVHGEWRGKRAASGGGERRGARPMAARSAASRANRSGPVSAKSPPPPPPPPQCWQRGKTRVWVKQFTALRCGSVTAAHSGCWCRDLIQRNRLELHQTCALIITLTYKKQLTITGDKIRWDEIK